MWSAAVSRMDFELVLNRGFESVDDKEQTFASLPAYWCRNYRFF